MAATDGSDRLNEANAEGSCCCPGLVRALVDSIIADSRTRHLEEQELPSRDAVGEMVELIRAVMFPGFSGRPDVRRDDLCEHIGGLLERIDVIAQQQIARVLCYERVGDGGHRLERRKVDASALDGQARELSQAFLATFPELRRLLTLDVQAAYEGDPAATHIDETIFCYPGVDAIFAHRVSHELYTLGVPLIPRMINEMAHSRTGIDINPGARIGESFFIDHGGGVVIGETTQIGNHVRIYQGVTLGNKSFEIDDEGNMVRGTKRHPTLGDRVVVYADACILGGDTIIGDDCIISGSVYVTESVPTGHIVRQKKPELVMRTNTRRLAVPGQPIERAADDEG